jgi:transcriptional regulator with XRE-family HTH domain
MQGRALKLSMEDGVGGLVAALQDKMNLTDAELGAALSVSTSQIAKWRRNQTKPTRLNELNLVILGIGHGLIPVDTLDHYRDCDLFLGHLIMGLEKIKRSKRHARKFGLFGL